MKMLKKRKVLTIIGAILGIVIIIICVSSCGKQNIKPNLDTSTEQVIRITDSKTPYYDSLKENIIYFKLKDEDVVKKSVEFAMSMADSESVINDDISNIKESYAKYLYKLGTSKQICEAISKYLNSSTTYKNENLYNDVVYDILLSLFDNWYDKTYIENDELIVNAFKYSNKKYGSAKYSLEQMNIKLEEVFTKDELDKIFHFENNNLVYEKVLNDLFLLPAQNMYTEKLSATGLRGYILSNYFEENDNYDFVYNLNNNVVLDNKKLNSLLLEWGVRLDEAILKSKLKYGELTKDGLEKIKKPKVITK